MMMCDYLLVDYSLARITHSSSCREFFELMQVVFAEEKGLAFGEGGN